MGNNPPLRNTVSTFFVCQREYLLDS